MLSVFRRTVEIGEHVSKNQRTANNMSVSYQRQQTGHSLTKWIILSLVMVGIPWLIYYSVSPNHYWHA